MSNSTSAGWSSEPTDSRRYILRQVGLFAVKGLGVGLLAGMGGFVYNMTQFVPVEVDVRVLLVPMLAAGAFAHLLESTLRRSVRLAFAGFFVGLFVLVGAWIAPLWILGYPPQVRGLMLLKLGREVLTAAVIGYSAAYSAGYLFVLSVTAFWE